MLYLMQEISGVIRIFLAAFLVMLPLHAITVLPRQESVGEQFGNAFGSSFSRSLEQSRLKEQDRRFREQLQIEKRMADEMSHYNTVLLLLLCESSHPTIALPEESMKLFEQKVSIEISDKRTMGCIFKRKFNRVLSDGALVEWLWSLDISNETQKKFLSSTSMKYSKIRLNIELLDKNDFVISSCTFYADVFLNRGETKLLQGKWMIPLDQVSQASNFQIRIGY